MKRDTNKLAKMGVSAPVAVRAAVICMALAFLIPVLMIRPAGQKGEGLRVSDSVAEEPLTKPEETPLPSGGDTIHVLIQGERRDMPLEEYLWGVVAAEMPAAFEQEALNAQAIAARTYTIYRIAHPGDKHPDCDICGDAACCQAWISHEDRMKEWSRKNGAEYVEKITKAIESTEGKYLSYGGEPIMAAFHASSAGFTKSSLEVWGEDFPYLREVQSPEETDAIPNYYSTVTLPAAQCRSILQEALPKANLSSENCADWFGEESYDDSGLPNAIQIGGVWVDTGEVRTLFQLRSASFTVGTEGDEVTFYVTGYGHGVGMSQYGANALAKQGKTAEEILKWYYSGVEIQSLQN